MKRVGLFIGIDEYKNGIASLNCACSDAQDLSLAFARAQFDEVKQLLNGEGHCETILKMAEKLTSNLNAGDLFVLYFAGHGREINGTHYLVGPTGYADKKLYQRGSLSIPELVTVTDRPGINRLFILDCCRTNLLADRAGTFTVENTRDIAINAAIRKTPSKKIFPPLILNSCSAGEQSFEDRDAKHGYFTKSMLLSLQDRTIRNFTQFRNALKKNITCTPGEQNICWNGNLDRWENIHLFRGWEGNDPEPKPEPKSEPKPEPKSEPKRVLTGEEKKAFYEISVEVEEFYDSIVKRDGIPEIIIARAQAYVDSFLEFRDMKISVEAYQKLLKLQAEINYLRPKFITFDNLDRCRKSVSDLDKKLKSAGKSLSNEGRKLKKIAETSEKNGDYGLALDYWEQLVSEYRSLLLPVAPPPIPRPIPVVPSPAPIPRPISIVPQPVPIPRPIRTSLPSIPPLAKPLTPIIRKKELPEKVKNAQKIFSEISDDSVYFAPNIPAAKIQSALASYASGISPESILVLIDDTFFQGAIEGLVVTDREISAKTAGTGRVHLEFSGNPFFAARDKKILVNDFEWIQLGIPGSSTIKTLVNGLNLLSEAVEEEIPEHLKMMKNIIDSNVFIAPNIPVQKLRKAVATYAVVANPNDVLLLIDDTIWGGAREGLIITSEAVFGKELGADPQGQKFTPKTKFTRNGKTILVNGFKFLTLTMPEEKVIADLVEILNKMSKGI